MLSSSVQSENTTPSELLVVEDLRRCTIGFSNTLSSNPSGSDMEDNVLLGGICGGTLMLLLLLLLLLLLVEEE